MSQSLPNRRKRLVVNKPVQRRIIVGVTIIPMVALVGATISVAVLTGRVLDEARTAEQSLPTLGPLFVSLFLFIVAAGATVVISALRYSNRIAGPMYRLCKSMREIRDGDVSFTVKLRKGDELTEIADELNAMIAWIREHPPEGVELKLVPDPIANEVVSEEGEVAPSVDDVPSAITTPGREGRPTKR
ncbi:MAG: hypothetical protein H6832_02325 [Planctomycetes bacterium]|nr:hypothetical protein [Planctomycetota bacterium]MCB9917226.1 hypothetical protein [Planctomycetota bacterium]